MELPAWDESEPVEDTLPSWEDSTPIDTLPSWEESEALSDEDPSTARLIQFGFADQASDVENLGQILEAWMPLGEFRWDEEGFRYESPEDLYGSDFMAADFDTRRQLLADRRAQLIQEQYADVFAAGAENSAAATVGSVGGVLASPTTLIPVGQTLKGAAAIGAGLGGSYTALDQFAKTGEVSPIDVGVSAAIGGVAAPAVLGASRKVKELMSKRSQSKQIKEADSVTDNVELAMARAVKENVPLSEMGDYVSRATGLTREQLVDYSAIASRKPRVPTKQEAEVALSVGTHGIDPVTRSHNPVVDQFLGVLSTRIGNHSQLLKNKLRKLDMDSHIRTHDGLQLTRPFRKMVSSMPKETRQSLGQLLFNGEFKAAQSLMSRFDPEAATKFSTVRGFLKDTLGELKKAGYKDIDDLPNYFPRVVKNIDGLMKAVGNKRRNVIQEALSKRREQLRVERLPVEEESRIINNVLRGYAPRINNNGLSFVQDRSIPKVDKNLMQYYADPIEGLDTYIRSTMHNIERRKFFGQYGKEEGTMSLNMGESIDSLLNAELRNLSPSALDEVRTMLNARFINGEKGANEVVQAIRNVGYATTLANPLSAMTQLADLSVSAYANGIRNTLAAIVSPNKKINMVNFGLDDILAEEFANEAVMSKTLHKLFTISGFRSVDKFGKNTVLRAAFNKATRQARSPKGVEKLRAKYGKAFGSEFGNLVEDLKAGNITDNTKLLLWNELADVQPIALSEMPQKYLEAPNGRFWYSLKTWMLKQIDVLRRDIKQQWSNGNKKEAIRNAVAYSLLVPTANMTVGEAKNLMLGRYGEIEDFEDVSDAYIENVFKVFGGSEYLNDRYFKKGDLAGGLMQMVSPPINYISSVGESLVQLMEGEAPTAVLSELPLIGRFWYNWMEGGLEAFEDRQARED